MEFLCIYIYTDTDVYNRSSNQQRSTEMIFFYLFLVQVGSNGTVPGIMSLLG